MNQRKLHISPWVALLLAAVAVLGCVLAAVGVSFARYRSASGWEYQFQAQQSGSVLLGVMDGGTFTQKESAWVRVDDQLQLHFAVSNGTGADAFAALRQDVSIRVIASLGNWSDKLTLTVGENTYTATATAIRAGSALHRTFGDGWVLRFLDEQGNELHWTLSGAEWESIAMQLTLTGDGLTDTSLLQLQVVGE